MLIQVTQDDIDNGKPCSGYECPLGLAANRATGKECSVALRKLSIIILEPVAVEGRFHPVGETVNCDLPIAACIFYRDFDLGKPVKPFSFEIDY